MDLPRQNGGAMGTGMGMGNGRRDLSRAELFEDEKKRIIDSCFSKRDEDGSIVETYITHIRIVEFASHPTTPPPLQARTPQAEKPRVIIVAVRKSGRVRMHKSKENINGTFSIGKTWNLDDLSAIESFTSPTTRRDFRESAGDTGFTVTLGKPYFWQSQTDKEKKFFIASLIKIYGKYTGGRVPELSGFKQEEMDQVMGSAAGRRGQHPSPAQPPMALPPSAQLPPPPIRPPLPDSGPSQGSTYVPTPPPSASLVFPPSTPGRGPLAKRPNGSSSPAGSVESARGMVPRNQEALRRLGNSNKSQDSVANSFASRSDVDSLRPRSRTGPSNGPGAYGTANTEEMPPERRRPPMDPNRPLDSDLVPAPLMSPAMRRDPAVPPRNTDRTVPRKSSTDQRPMDDPIVTNKPEPTPSKDLPGAFPDTPSPAAQEAPQPPPSPSPPPPAPPPEPSVEEETRPGLGPMIKKKPVSPEPEAKPKMPPEPEEEAKPGLGPMIKSKKSKGDIAGAFWKAATAATSFKPRPGGAAERLRLAANKASEGPDGITAVVPAPPRTPGHVDTPKMPLERPKSAERTSNIPEVKVTVPQSNSRPPSLTPSVPEVKKAPLEEPDAVEEARRSVVAGNDVRYLATLGIDPAQVLDNRSAEFTKWLDYFGWVPGEKMRALSMEGMKVDVERELNKAQAGGWLARFREEDDRVEAIKKGIDVAMTECEELDNLLTLYSVELSTLQDDIAYIEAQGQGLQVQAANQKLLMKELESLLDTCAITDNDLQALQAAPLEQVHGLEEIETSLVTLYKAMMKIDPSMGNNEPRKSDDGLDPTTGFNTDFGKMRIVQEKKEMYTAESKRFMRRLVEFMNRQFDDTYREVRRELEGALSKKVDAKHHDIGRDMLWKYSPLILYARDVDLDNWNRIMQIYQDKSHPIYKSEFKDILDAWKRNARKPTGEEIQLLFTSELEKKEDGIATTARKLTVKRSQTLARSIRSPLGDSKTTLDKNNDGRSLPYEAFGGVLDDLLPLVEMEQNFIIDFFHATTLDQSDFPDVVAMAPPQSRRGGDLKRHRLMEPDRELARRVTRAMEVIFAFFEQNLQVMIDWVLSNDPLQGVGVLAMLERKIGEMSQSNQDFLNTMLQKLHSTLEGRFKRFVDEQVRGIEETKVKIKKRKGVISFVRIFPLFSNAVETMAAEADLNSNLRRTIDREYERILKSMFDSLKVIARENPAVAVGAGASADPEDKEALNFHILLIENMNHFLEEVDNSQQLEVLEEWREAASSEMGEHMGLYLNAIMRRPLGKLLEYLENIEAQLAAGKAATAVAAQPSNSRATFNKVLSGYDAREVRKGIEALRKRVDKHFGDADDPSLSRNLVNRMLRECEKFYGDVEVRISNVTTNVYGGDVLFEWPRAEVKAGFR